jgi:hypothetical protein
VGRGALSQTRRLRDCPFSDAGDFLIAAWDCGNDNPIRLRNRRMMLPVEGVQCMNYTVDLAKAARHERQNRTLAKDNRVISPSLWLWRPRLTDGSEIDVRFHLPENMQISVPWPQRDSGPFHFRLGESPESSHAPVVFGSFHYREVDVPGARLRVAVLRSHSLVKQTSIRTRLPGGFAPRPPTCRLPTDAFRIRRRK